MIEPGTLPYFDFLLALLAQNNTSVEKSFGRHVHWGYWPKPATALCNDDDYALAAERLTIELCEAAEVHVGQSILDAGCGFGGTVASINERYNHMHLTGLNLDHRQLARARERVLPLNENAIQFCQGNACKLPFADSSFDRVLAVECIFHFPSREEFFREAFRVLRPGGTLALSDFVPSAFFRPFARVATEAPWLAKYQYFGQCNLQYSLGRYRRLAKVTGFNSVFERDITYNTLPTYRYLQHLLRHAALIEGITDRVADLVGVLKVIGMIKLLNYYLLAFRKPFGAG